MNSFGRRFRISIMGESHGDMVGVLVDGVPDGVPFSEADVQPAMDRRRPGQSLLTTQRQEADRVRLRSGVLDGRTTGAPILMEIENDDARSQDYTELRDKPRPGHSDYPARVRFHGMNDPRGSGMFSGRLTAAWTMAGALAAKILVYHGIQTAAHATRVGHVVAAPATSVQAIRDTVETTPIRTADLNVAAAMVEAVDTARKAGDSVGGVIECMTEGLPVGLGDPLMDSVESLLAHAFFSVPAVKGIEFGDGFHLATLRGSEARDAWATQDGRIVTTSNHNGGILGGMTTGMPMVFRLAFKPTSSIPLTQDTVDLRTGEPAALRVKGRHDPCIVPRAVPVVEAVTSCVLLDLLLERLGPERIREPWAERAV